MKIAVTAANSSVGLNLLTRAAPGSLDFVAVVRSDRAAGQISAAPGVQVRVVGYSDADGLADAVLGCDAVVHLAGILFESPHATYQSANVDTTAAVVSAAGSAGVSRVVFVSVLGADPRSPNTYLRSKGDAERIVEEGCESAAVLRTPILLGPGAAGAIPLRMAAEQGKARLLGGGAHILRPLDLDDLSAAILASCGSGASGVQTYELTGPEAVAHRELVTRYGRVAGTDIAVSAIPIGFAKSAARLRGLFSKGGFTPTVIDVITGNEHIDENADAALGIELTPLDETLRKIAQG